jgi:NADPH:quinone reductase
VHESAGMAKTRKTMRAAAIDRFGPPRVLKLRTLPLPDVAANEVRIAIHTAGVGRWDAEMRGGWWPFGKPRFPRILGTDGSGRIVAAGKRVRRFRAGDRVIAYHFANPKGGFYAEYVAVGESHVGHAPRGLDQRRAGAIPVTGLTALQGVEALRLKKGETVLIHGASGGVGTLAVQFAKLAGARVFATASRRSGVALVRGKPLARCVDALKPGGRLVYPNGVEAPRKRKGIRVRTYDGKPGVRQFQRLRRAIEASKLKVPILASYGLAHAARAQERVRKGRILGKIVLRVR